MTGGPSSKPQGRVSETTATLGVDQQLRSLSRRTRVDGVVHAIEYMFIDPYSQLPKHNTACHMVTAPRFECERGTPLTCLACIAEGYEPEG